MEINAVEFRANCFKILDQVKVTHKEGDYHQTGRSRLQRLVHFVAAERKRILSLEAWKVLLKPLAI